MKTQSGSEAKRGDLVRNLTTGELGFVRAPSQSGRIYVVTQKGNTPMWERWNVEVIHLDQ